MNNRPSPTTLLCALLLLTLAPLAGCGLTRPQVAAPSATAQPPAALTSTPGPTAAPTLTPADTAAPAPTLTPTPIPSATAGPRAGFSIKDLTFSFSELEGWEAVADADRAGLIGPTLAGTQLVVTFTLDQYGLAGAMMDADDVGIALYSAYVQDTITGMTQDVEQVSEEFLQTAEGKPYFRWVMQHNPNGTRLHTTFYILGSGKWFLVAMYARPASAGAEYDVLVDEAVRSLRFDQ